MSKTDSTQPGYGQYENDPIHQMEEKDSEAGTIEDGGSTRYAKAGGYFKYQLVVNKDKVNSVLCQFAKEDNGKTIKISVGDTVIVEKTLNYTGDQAFYSEYFAIPAEVLASNVKTIQVPDNGEHNVVPVKFESASASADSARLVGGLFMTTSYNTNAAITELTSSNGEVRQNGDVFTVYLLADTGSTKLGYTIADRYGLLYINDELINDARKQEYFLTQDTTTLSAKVYAEDHETSKQYTIQILRGVEAPSDPKPAPDTPGSSNPPATQPPAPSVTPATPPVTPKPGTVKKGKSITLTAKLTNVSGKVKWSVNKKKLAKITAKGKNKAKLKALKKGKVKVTAKIKKVKKTITIKIK